MPICLREDASVRFDQVVVGTGEAICESLRCGCFHHAGLRSHARRVRASELERGKLRGRMLSVVNGELGKTQPIRPLILLFGTEKSQILLHFPIHDFCLTIRLRVMRGR